jgi:2-deoxy-D-gluconate 3-dehydrogenase
MTIPKAFPAISQLVSLDGKRAIVTGGAQGIGFAIANRFAEAGAGVVIADTKQEKGVEAVKALAAFGRKTGFVRCDVTNEVEVAAMVKEAVGTLGGVDILVNNAGIFPFALTPDMTGPDFMNVMDVNLKGAFVCAREAARQMTAQGAGGCIINICSIDSLHPSNQGLAAYDASKGGLLTLTKSLAIEFGPDKIKVNAIAPGGVFTEGTRKAMAAGSAASSSDMRAWLKAFLARTALKRMGTPDEIGRVALFLASDLSAYMTGSLVIADGGMLVS